ncbi:response regulator [Actinosynnema sp. ALI-1.44]|uniref:response regulator n=1 Tax=Actinosynnema sp. ALI-1.44 TaxID=1933779 RepID=UPI00143D7BDE|nr:response regulator [Actinosynnema sp. ALI-1.44]
MPRRENPIDESQGPRAFLAARLRELRADAGGLSYREMSARTHYSASVLSQAAAGVNLPSWPVVRAFVEACGGDVHEWELLWQRVSKAEATRNAEPGRTGRGGYSHVEKLLRLADVGGNEPPPRSTRAKPISVFLLDDHVLLLDALKTLINDNSDMTVVGAASTAAEALATVPVLKPDVAVLDVRLPDGDGVQVCRDLRAAIPDLTCLMLTSYSDDQALFESVMAGAAGYVLKEANAGDLLRAIRIVAMGGSLLDPATVTEMVTRLRGRPAADRVAELTEQERKVLEQIGYGLTNRQIAAQLNLAEKTVKNYVSNLLSKLGMVRRTQAAVLAVELRNARRKS